MNKEQKNCSDVITTSLSDHEGIEVSFGSPCVVPKCLFRMREERIISRESTDALKDLLGEQFWSTVLKFVKPENKYRAFHLIFMMLINTCPLKAFKNKVVKPTGIIWKII